MVTTIRSWRTHTLSGFASGFKLFKKTRAVGVISTARGVFKYHRIQKTRNQIESSNVEKQTFQLRKNDILIFSPFEPIALSAVICSYKIQFKNYIVLNYYNIMTYE